MASAALEWMAVADLGALSKHSGVRDAASLLVRRERFDAYALASGLDLRRAGMAVVAKYPLSTLYLVETQEGPAIERHFAERLDEPPMERSPHPRIRSLLGVRSGYPRLLVSVRDHFVALAVGDPTPARVAELYALGKLRSVAPALAGAALGGIPQRIHQAPLRFYAPGPFEGEWARGARGLLGGATAIAASAEPEEHSLTVRVLLLGAWEPVEDLPRAERAWTDFVDSPLGALVGATDLAEPARVESLSEGLELTLGLRTRPLAQGIRAAVSAELEEILQ